MATDLGETALLQGATVFDRHGERIGIAADPGGAVFVVEEGIWFVKDRYLPKDVIARVDKAGVYLRISKGKRIALAAKNRPARMTRGRRMRRWRAMPPCGSHRLA